MSNPDGLAIVEAMVEILDPLPLECDGMTRCASMILSTFGIAHEVFAGSLQVTGVGTIGCHMYLALPSGEHFDLRARMWLGEDLRVPHGVFFPSADHDYRGKALELLMSPIVFTILSGRSLDDVTDEVRASSAHTRNSPRA